MIEIYSILFELTCVYCGISIKMLKIYNEYRKHGVDGYYKLHNKDYFNPHLQKIEELYIKYLKELIDSNTTILDVACGDGLIGRLVEKYNNNIHVDGTDPYFNNKYTIYNYSFEDISMGKLQKKYDMAICSYRGVPPFLGGI